MGALSITPSPQLQLMPVIVEPGVPGVALPLTVTVRLPGVDVGFRTSVGGTGISGIGTVVWEVILPSAGLAAVPTPTQTTRAASRIQQTVRALQAAGTSRLSGRDGDGRRPMMLLYCLMIQDYKKSR
jgi:hypothetical protein